MTINIRDEDVLTLAEAAKSKSLPRRRRRRKPHASTLYRWARHGLRGVRLEVIRVGGTLCTSTEALQRFFDRLTAAACNSTESPEDRAVESELDELGI